MKSELRDCGECTFCCTVMRIIELDKPESIKCKYCVRSGCSIYQERPASCRNFHCLWQFRKLFKDNKKGKYRPDKLGALLIAKKQIDGYSPALQFNALDRKVFERKDIKELVERFRKEGFNVALVEAGSKDSRLLFAKK